MKHSKLWLALTLIVWALFLSGVSDSLKPNPGESAKHQGQGGNDSQQRSQGDQAVSTPRITPERTTPDALKSLRTKNDAAKITTQHEQEPHPIWVAPINVNKDWLDYAFVLFSALLVIVGLFQIALLRRAFMAERPFIIMQAVKVLLRKLPKGDTYRAVIVIEVRNCGKSPAIINRIRLRHDLSWNGPEPSLTGPNVDDVTLRIIVAANETHTLEWDRTAVEPRYFDGRDLRSSESQDAPSIEVYGRIDYSDAFGKRRYRNFYWSAILPDAVEGECDSWASPDAELNEGN